MRSIIIAPAHEKYRNFVENLDEVFHKEGKTIYQERNEIKTFSMEDGVTINVKRFTVPNIINKHVYAFFRKPKAVRAYKNALRLKTLGINTPEPIGYMVYRTLWSIRHSYLVTFQSHLTRTMYEFGYSNLDGRDDIVRAFAHFTADLHDKGVYHKDFSPGNILFDKNEHGGYDFSLVDINRIKFMQVSVEAGCRNLCRLWGREDFLTVLADEYATVRNADKTLVRELIFKYHEKFWRNRRKHF
ncbi:lipopolysaccharide kinase InaA family protein [Porphyromonas sp.]|uniref:lipopolysaccharide kinase InaA family protein n=1 Tax=Porphyromonas sp. TaxID=1924944 RepID=UPI0026DCA28E|nr:lipopolysaccharide kinase InaA family protein [Porphyromonas sp.]MDO4770364.1 lipopolysaccharide kinase InaA family protein [Porphyromonas sp.]